jgi:hypothetical protein
MHEIRTEIEIRACVARVWSILTDFPSSATWNPFITHIEGRAQEGQRLHVTIKPVGARPMTFKPTVLSAIPNQELRWLGHLVIPGMSDGKHSFVLYGHDDGTRFVQNELFTGLSVPFLRSSLERGIRAGFEALNPALKQRAEQAA